MTDDEDQLLARIHMIDCGINTTESYADVTAKVQNQLGFTHGDQAGHQPQWISPTITVNTDNGETLVNVTMIQYVAPYRPSRF